MPAGGPKLVLWGAVGDTSACAGGDEDPDGVFIHWSQSCVILDKADFNRSMNYKQMKWKCRNEKWTHKGKTY